MARRTRYDPEDPAQVEKKETDAELRFQQAEADLRWLLADPRGQRIVSQMLSDAGIFTQSFVMGDASATAFREGYRASGVKLYAAIAKIAPDVAPVVLAAAITPPE